MTVRIDPSWQRVLQTEFDKPYFELLTSYVRSQYQTRRCFPPAGLIFNAFDSCPFDSVRVVIIGQDPYHEEGQAMGLSFSVPEGVQIPPSLMNIYKEIHRDLGTPIPASGDLRRWAEQGVLLLNATLTVEAHRAGSHQGKGWEQFTDKIIELLNAREKPMAFILWGSPARRKKAMITNPKHFIVESPHPSPLSAFRGFFGSRPFSRVNDFLQSTGQEPINWQLPNI